MEGSTPSGAAEIRRLRKTRRETGISYAATAPEYQQLGWHPIPVIGKTPVPTGATGRAGTVTAQKIAEWSTDPMWANGNTAIRHEESIGIDVDAYGDKRGDETIRNLEAELGELPVTITSTARGKDSPSRQHFYRVPAGLEFISKLKDVEIVQRSHRYSVVYPSVHPDTGEQYRWYGYDEEPLDDLPAIDDLEELPEAWLEFLTKPAVEHSADASFGGSVDEWLSKCAPGEPESYVREIVDSIPQTDFGHDVMVEIQARLVGLGADHRTGIPWALNRLREEWLRGPYNTPEFERDFNLGLAGAIEKFGNFSVPLLPVAPEPAAKQIDYVDAAMRVPGEDFFQAWIGVPNVVTADSLAERVRWIRDAANERGLTFEEAVVVAWESAARKHPQCQVASIDEVEAMPYGGLEERLFLPEPVAEEQAAEPATERRRRTVRLLTTAEEAALEDITWWGEEFMQMMGKVNRVMSEEYYRLNRWMILSLVFASRATIRRTNGSELPLNLYGVIAGTSSTGKSESLEPVLGVAEAYYELALEDSPDIGGDATAAGLTEALIMRDGKTSFFHADEADAVIRNWNNQQGEFRGMKQKITDFYGGRVPPIQRSTKKDISGIKAKAYLCVHLTGIQNEIAAAIEPRDWESGFLNRFLWAFGEEKHVDPEDDLFDAISSDEEIRSSNVTDWYRQWASGFRNIAESRLGTYGNPKLISFDRDVRERHARFVGDLNRIMANHRHPERLKPTINRWKATIMKCAALVAITDGRTNVQMSDFLIALEQMEEWVQNSLTMIELTDETFRAREATELAQIIARAPGKEMAGEDIHLAYKARSDWRYVDGLLTELEKQGRVERLQVAKDREPRYRLIEGRQ